MNRNGSAVSEARTGTTGAGRHLYPVHEAITESEKIETIKHHFGKIMETLGLDLKDDSLRETPQRVAKMFVKEIFSGLDERNFPTITTFENNYGYSEMLVERNITLHSFCEHHLIPFFGKAHIAYIPDGKITGLSKIARVVDAFSRRLQVQERLTMQIAQGMQRVLGTEDVAVYIEADHMCVASRGVEDTRSSTVTSFYGGRFRVSEEREAFLKSLV